MNDQSELSVADMEAIKVAGAKIQECLREAWERIAEEVATRPVMAEAIGLADLIFFRDKQE